jgi:hypothetical protein
VRKRILEMKKMIMKRLEVTKQRKRIIVRKRILEMKKMIMKRLEVTKRKKNNTLKWTTRKRKISVKRKTSLGSTMKNRYQVIRQICGKIFKNTNLLPSI